MTFSLWLDRYLWCLGMGRSTQEAARCASAYVARKGLVA